MENTAILHFSVTFHLFYRAGLVHFFLKASAFSLLCIILRMNPNFYCKFM